MNPSLSAINPSKRVAYIEASNHLRLNFGIWALFLGGYYLQLLGAESPEHPLIQAIARTMQDARPASAGYLQTVGCRQLAQGSSSGESNRPVQSLSASATGWKLDFRLHHGREAVADNPVTGGLLARSGRAPEKDLGAWLRRGQEGMREDSSFAPRGFRSLLAGSIPHAKVTYN